MGEKRAGPFGQACRLPTEPVCLDANLFGEKKAFHNFVLGAKTFGAVWGANGRFGGDGSVRFALAMMPHAPCRRLQLNFRNRDICCEFGLPPALGNVRHGSGE